MKQVSTNHVYKYHDITVKVLSQNSDGTVNAVALGTKQYPLFGIKAYELDEISE